MMFFVGHPLNAQSFRQLTSFVLQHR